jgi:hypothetical protein
MNRKAIAVNDIVTIMYGIDIIEDNKQLFNSNNLDSILSYCIFSEHQDNGMNIYDTVEDYLNNKICYTDVRNAVINNINACFNTDITIKDLSINKIGYLNYNEQTINNFEYLVHKFGEIIAFLSRED